MKKTLLFFLVIPSLFLQAQEEKKNEKEKTRELNEVVITKEKKAVEQKPDRTIFEFASQSHLNSGSVLEGIKKLPGLVASDVAGMLYQGKQLDVYMDGRPLNISSNELNSFLEGMPANSVERIEVITQPGAEFPATSGGAILNIITNKKAKSYLSATFTNSTNVTNYDKLRWRTNNSLLLSSKNKWFGWQLNLGQNYRESATWTTIEDKSIPLVLSSTAADRINRGQYAKSGLTFELGEDRLLLNYDVNYNNNGNSTLANGFGFERNDQAKTKVTRQDAVATYQKRFANDRSKKLDFKFNYNRYDNQFNQNSVLTNTSVLANSSVQDYYNFKGDYSQPLKLLDEGKFSFGALYEELFFVTQNQFVTNLDYRRRTSATYLEFQSTWKKFDFILGGRAEDYDISGKTDVSDLTPFRQFRFFPNASVQYNFIKQVYFNANYNKKISLPSTSALNPNNTNYQNPNVGYQGNPQLQPTIYDNYEVKISAFDYAFIGYNLSHAKNQVVNRALYNGGFVTNTNENIADLKIHNFNIGIPLPYMLFTKGIQETMKFDFNPDKINFLYAYAGYQWHEFPDISTKGFWVINLMSQIVLPKEIKFVTNFSYISPKGNYYYYIADKPFNNSLDLSFSKKFLKDQLTVSVNADDVFNMNRSVFNTYGTPVSFSSKNDTRRFGFTVNYKIPTKNKLAKEDPNILNKDKKEEGGSVIGN